MAELKPCPFCACGAKAYQAYDGKWQVECFVCHARSWWADTKEKAEEKWNRRTGTGEQNEEMSKIAEMEMAYGEYLNE